MLANMDISEKVVIKMYKFNSILCKTIFIIRFINRQATKQDANKIKNSVGLKLRYKIK